MMLLIKAIWFWCWGKTAVDQIFHFRLGWCLTCVSVGVVGIELDITSAKCVEGICDKGKRNLYPAFFSL